MKGKPTATVKWHNAFYAPNSCSFVTFCASTVVTMFSAMFVGVVISVH